MVSEGSQKSGVGYRQLPIGRADLNMISVRVCALLHEKVGSYLIFGQGSRGFQKGRDTHRCLSQIL